jgi:DNA repair protein RecO (recombination protein O)
MPDRQRLYRTHAVVLRRRDYSDADRILTVFTPNYGKLDLIAKGVRKTTSRKAGHLELFGHTSLLVAQARTWDIITEAVTVESFAAMRGDLDKIGYASYLCELVDAFTEGGDENQPLWDLLLIALHELNGQPADAGPAIHLLLHWFELHLLSLAGFQPQLFTCLLCDTELEPVTNYIHLVEGGVVCPNCAAGRRDLEPLEPDVLKVLRFLQMRSWSTVSKFQVRPHILQRTGNLLYRYLLIVLERQIKSVDFLRRLESMQPAPIPG